MALTHTRPKSQIWKREDPEFERGLITCCQDASLLMLARQNKYVSTFVSKNEIPSSCQIPEKDIAKIQKPGTAVLHVMSAGRQISCEI